MAGIDVGSNKYAVVSLRYNTSNHRMAAKSYGPQLWTKQMEGNLSCGGVAMTIMWSWLCCYYMVPVTTCQLRFLWAIYTSIIIANR